MYVHNKPTFNTVRFDRNPFTCSCEGEKSLNDFRFHTFVGRFQSDGAATMAVKGLRQKYQVGNSILTSCQPSRVTL